MDSIPILGIIRDHDVGNRLAPIEASHATPEIEQACRLESLLQGLAAGHGLRRTTLLMVAIMHDASVSQFSEHECSIGG